MFLQVFSKKVCFCCILGCFAEKKLPQMSQILTDGACLEFCEFCVLWEYSSPTDCTDQHRWLVALVAAWVRQDAIPYYICVNPCYLWETFLCKKLLCVPWVLWEYHCLVGAAETAAPPEIASVPSVEVSSQQEISVRSVGSVGGNFKNVAAWAWQDAIPSYTMGSEMPCIF